MDGVRPNHPAMDAISPTDALLPLCASLILITVLVVRIASLRRRAWNTGDTVALLFATSICLGIAFPNAVLIAV